MNISLSKTQLRITALWAFSEAFLGGLLHGFHVPFTGLVLSSFAAVCIASLTINDYAKGKILKATLLVIIVKAILSPHTPPTAYFAVFLQGFFGELIFSSRLPFKISALLTGIFALLQTAFQKLIVLTILFGTGFWTAMDAFLKNASRDLGFLPISYIYYLALIYVSLHLTAGILAGYFAGKLPALIQNTKVDSHIVPFTENVIPEEIQGIKKKKNVFKKPLTWILFFLLVAAIYQIYTPYGEQDIIRSKPMNLLIRSVLILFLWYFFVAPFLLKYFRKWLSKQQNKFSEEVKSILLMMPEMKYITLQCWQKVSQGNKIYRIPRFIRLTFLNLLTAE